MKLVVSVLLENNDGQILLGKRIGKREDDECYCFPGGKVEDGEKLKAAAVREVKEETSVIVIPSSLHFIHYAEPGDKLIFFFWCQIWFGEIQNTEPGKCENWKWFDIQHWPYKVAAGIKLFDKLKLYEVRKIFGRG